MPDILKRFKKEALQTKLQQLRAARKKPSLLRRAFIPEPKGIEIAYSSQLLRLQKQANEEVVAGAAQLAQSQEPSAFAGTKKTVLALLALYLPSIAQQHSVLTTEFNFKKNDFPAANLVGINSALPQFQLVNMQQSWIHENVSLITNANAEQLARIEAAVLRATRTGVGGKQLQTEIREALQATNSRVKLIARDQIGKLNGQLDMAKQTNAGVEEYRWRSSRDERVRPQHASREGEIFRWDSPPAGGHPGQAIRCRCTADPVLETFFMSRKEAQETAEQQAARNSALRAEAIALSAKGRQATRDEARQRIREARAGT